MNYQETADTPLSEADYHIHGFMQKRGNSSLWAMELRLFCIN